METHIEVLRCKACHKLALYLDGERLDTIGAAGHGNNKCAGQWLLVAEWRGLNFPSIKKDHVFTPTMRQSQITPDSQF